jgi:hypothetical protein
VSGLYGLDRSLRQSGCTENAAEREYLLVPMPRAFVKHRLCVVVMIIDGSDDKIEQGWVSFTGNVPPSYMPP